MPVNVIVTGANRGIGLEFVRQFLNRGDRVLATVRNKESASELLELQKKLQNQLVISSLDLEKISQGAASFNKDLQQFGPVDLLINNAGVYGEDGGSIDRLKLDVVQKVFQVNVLGTIAVTQMVLPSLRRSKSPKIFHVSSMMGSITDNSSGGSYAYRISKTALNMFNKCLTFDFKEGPSIVLHPGWVKTEMGGPNAQITTEQSVLGLLKVIDKVAAKDSSKFFDFRGEELPW